MTAELVRLVEVGPRDGLQAEPNIVPTATKLELIMRLSESGLPVIEATSFVHPDRVPQLADAAELMERLEPQGGTRYPVLVPNLRGLERAVAAGAEELAVFTAATESFSQRNTNCSIDESLDRIKDVVTEARSRGLPVRAYISCVLGCPYEGEVPVSAVADVAKRLFDIGCGEISLGDTIGVGTPGAARMMFEAVASEVAMGQLAVHFHDTYGQALANILACMECGVRCIDASVAGLGGCPFAPGASGNVATEDVVYMLHGLGFATGVNLRKLALTGRWISGHLSRPNMSRAGAALLNTKTQ
ncbi:MAG: hydroxymethylglutaryl-CoA lyase [Xanthomonadales bacterium]|nr:hydroxymethylglutaryl-CoA lyase [Gammaproteobacteria bacterium]NNE05987.1 hydroxymethylglutaryl-CoA lyase [Xanthomonadales bacterium]NNL96323.1 hydroxymethylglutaryl-CoA lyase [Xanthomonadales bacterium]